MSELYESKSIVGKDVMDNGAKTIGKVKDIEINIESWAVESFLVKIPRAITKELGIGGLMGATARIKPESIEQIGDLVRLKLSAQEIAANIDME
jgi:sporulation protein YlmC with PRC-barrel domain